MAFLIFRQSASVPNKVVNSLAIAHWGAQQAARPLPRRVCRTRPVTCEVRVPIPDNRRAEGEGTVVWEGSGRKARPYSDWTFL